MDCKNCDEKQACVPFFLHENALMHYNRANKRMLVALITICVTPTVYKASSRSAAAITVGAGAG